MDIHQLTSHILTQINWTEKQGIRLAAVYLGSNYIRSVKRSTNESEYFIRDARGPSYDGPDMVVCDIPVFGLLANDILDFRYDGSADNFVKAIRLIKQDDCLHFKNKDFTTFSLTRF